MKEEVNHHHHQEWAAYDFKKVLCLVVCCCLAGIGNLQAQCLQKSNIFSHGERVEFDVYFKYGLMVKGGGASITITESQYEGIPAWNSELLLWTTGMIDKVFRVRDTIENYITQQQPKLLFSTKRSLEGNYYQIDNLTYSYKEGETHVHSFRRNLRAVRVDTALVGGDCVLDILGSLLYARSFDWNEMNLGEQYHLEVAMGRSVIPIRYRYEGQRILERDKVKFATRYFIVDIYDDAFTESKEALEIWIGDDKNHLPIKLRAKLKIGAMEAYYKEALNLRHPLHCRIEMPKK